MIETILTTLAISFAIQIIFFTFAASLKTDKFTDLSYGLTFVIISLYHHLTNTLTTQSTIITSMVVIWGLRLAIYLFIRILKTKKDKRFDEIRENFIEFAKFWILQGISIWIIIIPTALYLNKDLTNLQMLNYIGIGIWLTGFIIETLADYQKFVFKNDSRNKNKFIKSGLWKYSRHPNYLGEILLWWGIFLYTIPALSNLEYLSIISPIYITSLISFVSGIPLLEKRYDKKFADDADYQEYKKKTGILFPKILS